MHRIEREDQSRILTYERLKKQAHNSDEQRQEIATNNQDFHSLVKWESNCKIATLDYRAQQSVIISHWSPGLQRGGFRGGRLSWRSTAGIFKLKHSIVR